MQKRELGSEQATTTPQATCLQLEISLRQKDYPSSAFIRLLTMRHKMQDGAINGSSERMQSVYCEDTLHVKRIIVVPRSLLQRSIEQFL